MQKKLPQMVRVTVNIPKEIDACGIRRDDPRLKKFFKELMTLKWSGAAKHMDFATFYEYVVSTPYTYHDITSWHLTSSQIGLSQFWPHCQNCQEGNDRPRVSAVCE